MRTLRPKAYVEAGERVRDFWIGVSAAAIFVVVYVKGGWFNVFDAWLPDDLLHRLREWPALAGVSFLAVYAYRRWPLAAGGAFAIGMAFVLQFVLFVIIWSIAGD